MNKIFLLTFFSLFIFSPNVWALSCVQPELFGAHLDNLIEGEEVYIGKFEPFKKLKKEGKIKAKLVGRRVYPDSGKGTFDITLDVHCLSVWCGFQPLPGKEVVIITYKKSYQARACSDGKLIYSSPGTIEELEACIGKRPCNSAKLQPSLFSDS